MKLTHERLKQIIKEELQSMQEADEEQQSMQEADEEQQTLERIKTELYNLHSQLANDGVDFNKYGKVTDPTVTKAEEVLQMVLLAADKFEKNSQTAFKIMDKLRDLLIKRDALAKLPTSPVKRI